tara:strand:+ start:13 stop:450 length:438 start_codon:yes stop_codon:yes gene_type:complete
MLDFFLYASFLKHVDLDMYNAIFPVAYAQEEWFGDEATPEQIESVKTAAASAEVAEGEVAEGEVAYNPDDSYNPTVMLAVHPNGRFYTMCILGVITMISILHSIICHGFNTHIFFAALFPLTNVITIIISLITFGILFGCKKKKK